MVVNVNAIPKTLREYLNRGVSLLKQADIESYALDARVLLRHSYGLTEEELVMQMNDPVDDKGYFDLILRRSQKEPVAKIIGFKEFYGLDFITTKDTLDPRPDSEVLIDAVLKSVSNKDEDLKILDLGTGTGCLVITLLTKLKNASAVGVDLSNEAYEIACKNASKHDVKDRLKLVKGDFSSALELDQAGFDIIISNPPYIAVNDDQVNEDAKNFDPEMALYAGEDGLDAYRQLAPIIKQCLNKKGKFFLEIGTGQEIPIGEIFKQENLGISKSYRDIQGIIRCLSNA